MVRETVVTAAGVYGFFGDCRFLSNFYECPVTVGGKSYRSSEAAYQAQKSSSDLVRDLFTTMSASEAKRAGRDLQVRQDWEQIKVLAMVQVLFAKFKQNPLLLACLKESGNRVLEERNDWGDVFWGVSHGKGLNMLGQCLMVVRDNL